MNITIHDSDGKNETAPPKGTLFVRAGGVEGAKNVRVPRELYEAAYALAALAEGAAVEGAEEAAAARLAEIEAVKAKYAAEREGRARVARGEPFDPPDEDK